VADSALHPFPTGSWKTSSFGQQITAAPRKQNQETKSNVLYSWNLSSS